MADEATQETTGADETSVDTNNTAATESATDAGGNEGEAALGDAGKKALDAMKAKWKEAEARAKEQADTLAALQAKIDGKEAEHQKALDAQRVKDEALSAANQRILKAEIRAAAAGKLADPTDALAYIDLSSFEVSDDGVVDSDAIGAAITDLITKKPYLGAQGTARFQGSADGGARNDSKPASLDEQIIAAEKDGDWNTANALKAKRLLEIRSTNS